MVGCIEPLVMIAAFAAGGSLLAARVHFRNQAGGAKAAAARRHLAKTKAKAN